MSKDNSLYKTRRDLITTTAAVGGLFGVSGLVGRASGEETTEIVTHKKGDKPVISKEVPKAWYQHLQLARKVKSNLTENYYQKEGFAAFSLTTADSSYGGKKGFGVRVKVTSTEAKNTLPDQVRGIPIFVDEYTQPTFLGCYNEGDNDVMPGGVAVDGATSGSQYYVDLDGDGDTEQSLITAAHIIGDQCYNLLGYTVDQGSDEWGTVELQSTSNDVVACQPNSGYDVDNVIQEENDTPVVAGHMSKDGISDLAATQENVRKTGRETGTVKG